MARELPTKLTAEPIIDAVIELRLEAGTSLVDVVPGVLKHELGAEVQDFTRLPVADIPKQIRDQDPNLHYQPLMRISLPGYVVLVGDRVVALACALPYPGGEAFKDKALSLFKLVFSLGIVSGVTRYSIKYVDFIPSKNPKDVLSLVDLRMEIGGVDSSRSAFTVRLDTDDKVYKYVIQLTAPVNVAVDHKPMEQGILIDIDTICEIGAESVEGFFNSLPDKLNNIHLASKTKFFGLLTDEGLKHLGAE